MGCDDGQRIVVQIFETDRGEDIVVPVLFADGLADFSDGDGSYIWHGRVYIWIDIPFSIFAFFIYYFTRPQRDLLYRDLDYAPRLLVPDGVHDRRVG